MLGTILGIALLIGIVALIVHTVAGEDRYARMSEKEFEQEAEKNSLLAAGMLGLQKVLQPKRVEYVMAEKRKNEAQPSPSGDASDTSAAVAPPAEDSPEAGAAEPRGNGR